MHILLAIIETFGLEAFFLARGCRVLFDVGVDEVGNVVAIHDLWDVHLLLRAGQHVVRDDQLIRHMKGKIFKKRVTYPHINVIHPAPPPPPRYPSRVVSSSSLSFLLPMNPNESSSSDSWASNSM